MEFYDLTEINKDNTLFGVPIQQSWSALFMLEKLLTEEKFKTIIELGTGNGALTSFFQQFALTWTYDIKNGQDVLDDHLLQSVIKSHIEQGGKTLVFCDNGNKKREFAIYSQFLKKGDHILIHDYRRPDGFQEFKSPPKGFRFFWQKDFDRLSTWICSLWKR